MKKVLILIFFSVLIFSEPHDNFENLYTGINYLLEKRDDKTAEKYFLKAINEDNNPNAYVYLGIIYNDRGDKKLAEKYFLLAIEKRNTVMAMTYLGLLYQSQGKDDLAEKYYLMGVEYEEPSSTHFLGLLYGNHSNYGLAEKYLKMVLTNLK